MLRDVTREVRLEQMRKDFVANASHELRSPLTVVAGYLETFRRRSADLGELAAPIAEMRRQTDRMTRIIEDLLELSRFEASDAPVKGSPSTWPRMAAMLRKDVLGAARASAAGRRLRSNRRRISSATKPWCSRAFSNLVDNAAQVHAARRQRADPLVDGRGRAVTSRCATPDREFPPEHLPRLTERFYRVDPGRSRETGGSGLGLAIVKHALHRHGGRLEIDSVEGRGSTFTCHFPPERVLERRLRRPVR